MLSGADYGGGWMVPVFVVALIYYIGRALFGKKTEDSKELLRPIPFLGVIAITLEFISSYIQKTSYNVFIPLLSFVVLFVLFMIIYNYLTNSTSKEREVAYYQSLAVSVLVYLLFLAASLST